MRWIAAQTSQMTKTAHPHTRAVQDGESLPDHRHVPLIEIAKGRGAALLETGGESACRIASPCMATWATPGRGLPFC